MKETARAMPSLDANEARLLLQWMREEASARRRLAEVLVAMEPALVRAEASGLQQGLAAAEPVFRHLEELARRRENLIQRIAQRIGLRTGVVIKISALVQIAPEHLRTDLESARQDLRRALRQLAERTRRHTLVSKTGLELTQKILRVAFGEDSATSIYDRAAKPRDPVPTKSYLDQEL